MSEKPINYTVHTQHVDFVYTAEPAPDDPEYVVMEEESIFGALNETVRGELWCVPVAFIAAIAAHYENSRLEQVKHILSSGYGSLRDAENDLRAVVGLPPLETN